MLEKQFKQLNEIIAQYSDANQSENLTFEARKQQNQRFYEPFLYKNYQQSFANPSYCQETMGDIGPMLSVIYSQCLELKDLCYHKDPFAETMQAYLLSFEALWKQGQLTAETIQEAMIAFARKALPKRINNRILKAYSYKYHTLTDKIMQADLTKPDYLFDLNVFVDENEIKLCEYMNTLPQKQLDEMAVMYTDAYLNGYTRNNMDRVGRRGMSIATIAGLERFTKALINELQARGFNPFVYLIQSTSFNKQFEFDHKFDNAIYLDQTYYEQYVTTLSEAFVANKACQDYSGIFYIERFGEAQFSPAFSDARLTYSKEQRDISQKLDHEFFQAREVVIPEKHRNFSIISFPVPEIHDQFEAVFNDILAINALDSHAYESIQKKMIDVLDEGEYVHVVGYNGNKTDIKVQLQAIEDTTTQTGFFNCGADVNIPVGEVFTSPKLTGTTGLLHLKEIYLEGLNYIDLKLIVKDGYTVDYASSNFDDPEESKKYVRDNLLFPHDQLPLGEFAIGTNTLAYAISKKYGIIERLPILIIEKMGPHFAIGDTCYHMTEDLAVYNPDNKRIIAKDNERSIKRKQDINQAYTNVHTDITIPYEEIYKISVVKKSGEEIDLIKEGRFVLKGTESLNQPLDTVYK
jgi:leucyl aminopeptidase (aminopeptidase T)